jgi:hypothetical protein
MEYRTINTGAGTIMMASYNFNIWLKGKHMQSYLMITLLPIAKELESIRHVFLDCIDENSDNINSKNLENVGRHAFQHHVR